MPIYCRFSWFVRIVILRDKSTESVRASGSEHNIPSSDTKVTMRLYALIQLMQEDRSAPFVSPLTKTTRKKKEAIVQNQSDDEQGAFCEQIFNEARSRKYAVQCAKQHHIHDQTIPRTITKPEYQVSGIN